MTRYFITGTDTGMGKTFMTCRLLHHARLLGQRTLALKPVASDASHIFDDSAHEEQEKLHHTFSPCLPTRLNAKNTQHHDALPRDGSLYRNADALMLQHAATVALPYAQVNPFCFKDPIAPHIAAQNEGRPLMLSTITAHITAVADHIPHDLLLIEGVGGVMVPFNTTETQGDLMKALGYPVILVVGLRLGCLNHALLSMAALRALGVTIKGWMSSSCDPCYTTTDQTLRTLCTFFNNIPYYEPASFFCR